MDEALLSELIEYIERNDVASVGLGYYGELTLTPGWWRMANSLADRGVQLTCTTNCALPWSNEEVSAFARFTDINISVDTHDADVLKRVRKKLDIKTVVYNHQALRAHCLEAGISGPRVVWSGVLTHYVAPTLVGFVHFAAANAVSTVHFNEVGLYEGAPEHGIALIEITDDSDFVVAAEQVEQAFTVATKLGIALTVAGIERIRARRAAIVEGRWFSLDMALRSSPMAAVMTHNEGNSVPSGYTRACYLPWSSFYFDPKGQVFACCTRGDVMGTARTRRELESVIGNEAYRELRRSLATGVNLDPACATCTIAPLVRVSDFMPAPIRIISRRPWLRRTVKPIATRLGAMWLLGWWRKRKAALASN